MGHKVYIIGMGEEGLVSLTEQARRRIEEADVLLGSEHVLRLVPEFTGERVPIGADLQEVVDRVEAQRETRRLALVAIGDPLFHGVARYLCERVGAEHFEIVPHVSIMQLAFARVKQSWEEAYLTNVAGRPIEAVLDRIRVAEKVGLFTDGEHPPAVVARELLDRGIDYFQAYVCENLGAPDERVTHGELSDIAGMDFGPLNVMILVRLPGVPDKAREGAGLRLFGNPDDVFIQRKPRSGLVTQAEVRAIALAEMNVRPTSIVWDIGAGSGSVSIESAQLAHQGTVYAIEQNVGDYHLIQANMEKFGVHNVKAIHGHAPEALADLPCPDCVFIGGTGRYIAAILDVVYDRLKPGARLVLTLASIDGVYAAHKTLRKRTDQVQVHLVQISRSRDSLELLRLDAVNPTFLLVATKAEPDGTST